MTEPTIDRHPDSPPEALPDEGVLEKRAEALLGATAFLEHEVPYLGRLTGLDVDFQIGDAWATDLRTGNIVIDPRFFVDRDYTSDHAIYATLHELWAHVRDVKRNPNIAARQLQFAKKGAAERLFNNILADILGNKLMHNVLPAMADVAIDLYDTRLFPDVEDGEPVDYSAKPLHIQLMYKMIRDEMIPDSETPVRSEVDAALEGLRNYRGAGDVIKYLTDPATKISDVERFEQILAIIYPVYRQLLDQSTQEKASQQQSAGEGGQPSSDPTPSDSPGETDPSPGDPAQSDSTGEGDPFSEDYDDYFTNKSPQPISDDDIEKAVRESTKQTKPKDINPQRELDKQLRQETGFGLNEHGQYKEELAKNIDAIDRMRDVFKSIVSERVSIKRGLSRSTYFEGDLLDPNRLAQTIVDIKSGATQPEAYQKYESRKGRTETVGNTDYIFVFDRSGSMDLSGKTQAAATAALIMLEGLSAVERDIQAAEAEYSLDLDLDIRTALYVFNGQSTCLKPLGNNLSDRERLTTHREILRTSGSTADFITLQDIASLPRDNGRQRFVIVVSDGESDNPSLASAAIRQLRQHGVFVYGVGIGSDDATELYKPYCKRVDNPDDLPDVLESFILGSVQ